MKKTIALIVVILVITIMGYSLFRVFNNKGSEANNITHFTKKSTIGDVIHNTSFKDYGHLIFPVDRTYNEDTTLDNIDDIYVWYNYIDDDTTVEIINFLKEESDSGEQVFYPIYTEEEMRKDSDKRNVGLFFFRGKENNKTAIINAGGGFMYVGAMQDSFPHALELSKMGYNAFALIYRPDADKAMEDLARATAYLHENSESLKIDMKDYSVWGGSAGGRMTAWISTYGTESFGEKEYPRPSVAVIAYTGLSEVTGDEVPTYSVVGTNDGIADYRVMEDRINNIKKNGTDAEIEVFDGLPHGFGVGKGTKAEGWIKRAVEFWKNHM